MTGNTTVKMQLEALEKSAKKALESKASALQFLREAGIQSTPLPGNTGKPGHPKKH